MEYVDLNRGSSSLLTPSSSKIRSDAFLPVPISILIFNLIFLMASSLCAFFHSSSRSYCLVLSTRGMYSIMNFSLATIYFTCSKVFVSKGVHVLR